MRIRRIDVGDVTLSVREQGEGPLVILLHGFPDHSGVWEAQIHALAQAGFHVLAPDMRGYGSSDKPEAVQAYALERLSEDVATLVRAVGARDAVVVGHDWGAVVAWQVAMSQPDVVRRLVIVNVPHPQRMLQGLRTAKQLLKSWYIGFFQLPWLPELALAAGNQAVLRRVYAAAGMRGHQLEDALLAAERTGGHGVDYYRAAARAAVLGTGPRMRRIDVPVLVLWGEDDPYLGKELATPSSTLVPQASVRFFPGASHWLQVAEAEAVSEALIQFARGE